MQVPMLKKCCFCVPLRCGLITWAYLRLIYSIAVAGFALLELLVLDIFLLYSISSFTIPIVVLILSILMLLFFDIVFNFALIVACHKNNTTLLRLYFRFGIAYAIVFVMFYVAIIAFNLFDTIDINDLTDNSWNIITIFSSICGALLILHMYLLLMVNSEILRLKQSSSQLQFVNRITVPSRIKHVESLSISSKKEKSSEKPLPSASAGSKNDWLYLDNKNFSI